MSPIQSAALLTDANNVKIRQEYMNSAVYVETTYAKNPNQAMYFPGSGDHPKTVTVKRCACFSNPDECPCHPQPPKEEISQAMAEGYGVPPMMSMAKMKEILQTEVAAEQVDAQDKEAGATYRAQDHFTPAPSACALEADDANVFESDSGITVKASNSTSDFHLSIPSLTSMDTVCANGRNFSENYRDWCRRKDTEKKLAEEREELIRKIKEQQKQAVVELERENFKRWLATKRKKEEEEKLMLIHQKEEEQRQEEEERSKRMAENERNYQAWLRRKEKNTLEKKIKEQLTLIELEEEKQRRLEINRQAYEHWKEISKNRQKPVPFGLGIETLKSSASVSYINPQPWVPNIDVNKPHSQ